MKKTPGALLRALFSPLLVVLLLGTGACFNTSPGSNFDPEPGMGLGMGMFINVADKNADGICKQNGHRVTFEQCRAAR